ncbi:hypothetical protein [Portibacter marinus]|uniref:hypothetical protein n=1 Tax=Portibacter marinus TaxID=2898660 RepID=UPI001F379D0C|nr:hypothetical protein [Portibacter marinus]
MRFLYFKYYCFLLCLLSLHTGLGQRFSLLAEAGIVRAQIDGDKIQGFHYPGYVIGIGTHYSISIEHALSVKTSYYRHGSRAKDSFLPVSRSPFQMQMDLNSIGLEFSYKFEPKESYYFVGGGFVRHQLVQLKYDIVSNPLYEADKEKFILTSDQLSSSYVSFKIYYGLKLFNRADIYFALETGFTDLLKEELEQLQSLNPYSLSAVFTYEIIAAKVEERKVRPGRKIRE